MKFDLSTYEATPTQYSLNKYACRLGVETLVVFNNIYIEKTFAARNRIGNR